MDEKDKSFRGGQRIMTKEEEENIKEISEVMTDAEYFKAHGIPFIESKQPTVPSVMVDVMSFGQLR